jgi:hypothetical protein
VAAVVPASAQVYSVNTVGYVNVDLVDGFNMIGNPLATANNTVADLFPPVDGMTVFKWVDGTGYVAANYVGIISAWDNPTLTLDPGEGAFVSVPAGAGPVTVTFVGEVMETQNGQILQNPIPQGLSIKTSMVPQEGGLSAVLGFPAVDGDTVFKFVPGGVGYQAFNYVDILGGWAEGDPQIGVGEAIFINKIAATSWDRDFNVSP